MMLLQKKGRTKVAVATSLLLLLLVAKTKAELIITEVAPRGSSTVCQGRDWVELHNTNTTTSVDLHAGGYVLHDDKGLHHEDTFFFPEGTVMEAEQYLLLCTKGDDGAASPQFGIGRDDTITLATVTLSGDSDATSAASGRTTGLQVYEVVSSVGPLPVIDVIEGCDVSYALDPSTGTFDYTSMPTPGAANTMTPAGTTEEQVEALKKRLRAQNALGTNFFNMDDQGYSVPDGMDTVVDLRLVMLEENYNYLLQNTSYEVYRPFESAAVTTRDNPNDVLLELSSPGRVRPKGQFSLYMPLCVGSANFPFQLDFDTTNSTQTLFGVERVYLRTHFGDNSYARDWAYYRMAARFGLPHLRARKVRFFISDQLFGFYTLLEAPDQDYVFHRNFPLYDPTNFGLYKVKTMALGCGRYSDADLEAAQTRMDSGAAEATPPYVFERGEHQPIVPVLGPMALNECFFSFFGTIYAKYADSALAYLRYDKTCPDMLLKEGLIDRDLGTNGWDKSMEGFIEAGALGFPNAAAPLSATTITDPLKPADWMDEYSILKMIAFYAVTINLDSPLGQGNNFYWLQTGEEANGGVGGGWKMFPYDFNSQSGIICGVSCDDKLVHWSIVQPTCSHLSKDPLVEPLLSDANNFETYLGYVREFVESVYGNETFVQEVQDQINAQDADVRSDSWSAGGLFYDMELSPDAAEWSDGIPALPLLPVMKGRAASVREQLDAIDKGTVPRGGNGIGAADYEMWETCPDWRMSEPPGAACPKSCRYEGCHMPGWVVESACNETSKTCNHGNNDPLCNGVVDGGTYEGMENGTTCLNVNGLFVKMSQCPPYADEQEPGFGAGNGTGQEMLSSTSTARNGAGLGSVLLALFIAAWF